MNAVGIDISKGKSMVAIMRPMGEIARKPFEVTHNHESLFNLANQLMALGDDVRVIMEATGRYHEPVAAVLRHYGLFVSILNPIVIKQSGAGSVRKVKSDKKDALKIAKYGLDNWIVLREHTPMDTTRQQLKLFSRQYNMYMKMATSMQNNLISLLDKTFPGANDLFDSPVREDGHQKWVDFVLEFWHCNVIAELSEEDFIDRYRLWCKCNGYNFSLAKAQKVYDASWNLCPTLSICQATMMLVTSAAQGLLSVMQQRAAIKAEVINLAQMLPEYECVKAMYGVGEITAAQLMAELGDIRKFANRRSIVAFSGIDPTINSSGAYNSDSNPSSKRGSPHLRKTLFQVVSTYLKKSPPDEPVFLFLDKKRNEGKPFYVYMNAAANKFLRIYYARVKEAFVNASSLDNE